MSASSTTLQLRIFALSALLALGSPGLLPLHGEGLPGLPGVAKGGWIVRLVRLERTGPDYATYTFTFNLENQGTKRRKSLDLANLTTELEGLEVIGDLFVVFGRAGSSADVVTIFGIEDGKVLDSFLCWWPKLSPTGHYIVAVNFYPRFTEPEMTSNVVVVYDLDRLRANPRQPRAGEAALEAIYPREPVGQPLDQGHRIANEADRHDIMPVGFLWTADEQRVVFLDRTEKTTFVVAVDLTVPPVSQRHALEVGSLLGLPKDSPEYERVLDQEKALPPVSSLRWLSEGTRVGVELDRERSANPNAYRREGEPLVVVDLEPPAQARGDGTGQPSRLHDGTNGRSRER